MKTTLVPAQVTTVEDKITGNLSLQQLLLLASPVFIGGAMFMLMPPFVKVTTLKVVIGTIIFVISASMAIRIRGKLLIEWGVVLLRYNVRPRYFIFNKNDSYLRQSQHDHVEIEERDTVPKKKKKLLPVIQNLPTPDIARLEAVIHDPRANFSILKKKGKLNVHITEIK